MRRSGLLALALATLAVLLFAGTPNAAAQGRPTVALLDFEFGSVQHWWSGNWDIGRGIADLIVDELVNDGSFRMIERKKLDAILAEQNFSNSERADPSAKTVSQLAKALGVKYLIVGSITKFGLENQKQSFGGLGAVTKGFGAGEVGRSKGKANVAITARIIDTSTGEIMVSAKGNGTSSRSGFLVGGGAGGGGALGMGNVSMGSSDFQDTILGEATESAVKEVCKNMIARKGNLTEK
jgi:curli biogenesis system outer membrane secretion channel CsgG